MFLLLVLLFFTGCSQPTNKEITPNQDELIEKTFDSFTLSNPRSSNEIYQESAKAIVAIFSATGSTGTGFFISEDGFLLTNAHVVKDFCTREECSNSLIFLRHFTQNGTMEKFTNFRILAINKALDFALVKIDLPKNEKVSFLEIDTETKNLSYFFENQKSPFIMGHLAGSQIRTSPTDVIGFEGGLYLLNSGAWPGNSGSPLIDLQTGKVIGLFHSRSLVEKNPNSFFKTLSRASRMELILPLITPTMQNFRINNTSVPQTLQAFKNIFPSKETPDFSIPSKEKLFENNPENGLAMMSQELGKKDSDKNALKWVEQLSLLPHVNQDMSEFAFNIISVELSTNKKLFSNEQSARIFLEKLIEIEKKQKLKNNDLPVDHFSFFKIQYGLQTQEECLNTANKNDTHSSLYHLFIYTNYCSSLFTPNGFDIIEALTQELDSKLIHQDNYRKALVIILNHQLLLRYNLSPKTMAQVKNIYSYLAHTESDPTVILFFEKQLLLLDHMPQMLLKGGFAETIH